MTDDTIKLVSLDQFRHAPAEETSVTASVEPGMHPRTRKRFEKAKAAIEKLKSEELAAIAVYEDPSGYSIRFSAAAVAREAGIGRTQIYTGLPELRQSIEDARSELDAALRGRCAASKPRITKHDLEERMKEMQARHDAELSRLASQSMTDLIRRMGPVLDQALMDRGGTTATPPSRRPRR